MHGSTTEPIRPLVRSAPVEMSHPVGLHSAEVALAKDQDVIEAFAAEAAEEPLTDRVQVRRRRRDGDHIDTRGDGAVGEAAPELAIVIPNQESRGRIVRRGLSELLGDPGVGRKTRDVDVMTSRV